MSKAGVVGLSDRACGTQKGKNIIGTLWRGIEPRSPANRVIDKQKY